MIEDKELRDLFKLESAEHMQKLSDGLLRLEKEPDDAAVLEEVFREAHSLKGAARMVGVEDVEALGHKIEDIFGKARKGEIVLSSGTIDELYSDLDSIRRFVDEAVGKEPRIQEPEAGMEKLESKILDSGFGILDSKKFKIDSVRVDTKILDMLMTQAGELAVVKSHIAHRVSEIAEIAECEMRNAELTAGIQNLKSKLVEDSARLDFITDKIGDGIRKIRLVPLATIFNLYPRMVRDMARGQGKEINLVIEGGETCADKRIVEEMKDPLMHMVRNSLDHGIERPESRKKEGKPPAGAIRIRAHQADANIVIEVSDDGRGLDIEAIREAAVKNRIAGEGELAAMTQSQLESLIFSSGFSTSSFVSDVSGRGVGLDVVKTNVERLKGTVSMESLAGKGCRFLVKLPVSLATVRVLIVSSAGRNCAIPMEFVNTSRMVPSDGIFPVAGRMTMDFDGEAVSVARLEELLEIPHIVPRTSYVEKRVRYDLRGTTDEVRFSPCIILSVNNEKFGIIVDALVDEQEVVLKPQSAILKHVRNVSGATILASGEVCMVLNPGDMLKSVSRTSHIAYRNPAKYEVQNTNYEVRKSILLAEDSITTRTQEKRILEGAGYEVVTAVDGLDAYTKLNSRQFDAVVSDVLMPNMDGLTLTERIRQDKRFKEIPVILVTSLASDEDRKRGLEAGANAYIAKPTFDQKELLGILERLV